MDDETIQRLYREQGYYVAEGLLPETATRKVLEHLQLAATQVLELHGMPCDEGLDNGSLLGNFRRILDKDPGLYLSILRLASRLQSVYALMMHPKIMSVLSGIGVNVTALPCGVAAHVVSGELQIPGGYSGWKAHQDWPSSQGSLDEIVLWIPLMDIHRDFYPLEVIPRSHKKGVLAGDRAGAEPRGALILTNPTLIDESKFVGLELRRGDALFTSGLLVHRTGSGTRSGVRIACGARFDNVEERTFIERGYPCSFRLHAETKEFYPGFPNERQLRELFG